MQNTIKLWVMGIFLALSVILAKHLIASGFHPIYVAMLQTIGSVLFLSFFGLKGLLHSLKLHFWYFLLASFLGFTIPQLLVFHAVEHLDASLISLTYAFPLVFTYLLSVSFSGEGFNKEPVIFLLVAFTGTLLFLLKTDFVQISASNLPWIAVVVLVPIVISFANIYRGRFWPEGAPVYTVALLTNLFSFFSYGFFALAKMPDLPRLNLLDYEIFVYVVIFMLLASAGQYLLFSLHRTASAIFIGQTGSVTTFFGGIFGFLFYGESYQITTLVGSLLILIGVAKFSRYQIRSLSSA